MTAMTDQEVREFIEKNEWNTGIKIKDRQPYEDRQLYNDSPEANVLYLKISGNTVESHLFLSRSLAARC